MSLLESFLTALKKCNTDVGIELDKLQKYASQQQGLESLWASGCQIKILGIIDACLNIEKYIPIVKSDAMDFENIVAMGKASYTYLNLHSLLHDTLDNIGFMYGVKIMQRSENSYAKSFLDIVNESTGELKTPSNDSVLNQMVKHLFGMSKSFIERDNAYKHLFAPGLIYLIQPESFIRTFPFSENIVTYLDKGAVKIDDAMEQVSVVRMEILPLVVKLILKIGNYKMS